MAGSYVDSLVSIRNGFPTTTRYRLLTSERERVVSPALGERSTDAEKPKRGQCHGLRRTLTLMDIMDPEAEDKPRPCQAAHCSSRTAEKLEKSGATSRFSLNPEPRYRHPIQDDETLSVAR